MIVTVEFFVFQGTEDLVYRYSVDLDALLEFWDGQSWVPAEDADFTYLASGTLRPISLEAAVKLTSGTLVA